VSRAADVRRAVRAGDDPSTAAEAVAAYDGEELAAAVASDVATGTRDDPAADTVEVSPPFRWDRGTVGGERGILERSGGTRSSPRTRTPP